MCNDLHPQVKCVWVSLSHCLVFSCLNQSYLVLIPTLSHFLQQNLPHAALLVQHQLIYYIISNSTCKTKNYVHLNSPKPSNARIKYAVPKIFKCAWHATIAKSKLTQKFVKFLKQTSLFMHQSHLATWCVSLQCTKIIWNQFLIVVRLGSKHQSALLLLEQPQRSSISKVVHLIEAHLKMLSYKQLLHSVSKSNAILMIP